MRVTAIGQPDPKQSVMPLSGPRAMILGATQLGLIEFDGDGRVVPGLAMSWHVSQDGLSYIFRLRDAAWSDRRTITAGDVVAVLRRILDRGSNHPLKPYLYAVVGAKEVASGKKPDTALGIDAVRENVVEIRLTTAQPDLLTLLAHPSMAIIRSGEAPPAGGAFRLPKAASDPIGPIQLVRNEEYYDEGSVPLAGIKLESTSDELFAVRRFRSDEADVVTGATIVGLGEARTVPAQNALRVEPSWGVYGYLPYMRDGPLADVRVRRALSMSIDRDGIVNRLFAIPAMQPVVGLSPPNLSGANPGVVPDWTAWPFEIRLEEARRLLSEGGYGPENPLVVRVSVPRGREHANVLQAVANEWARIGVTVQQVVRRESDAASDPFAGGEVHLALVERIAPFDSALFFLSPFDCGPSRVYCNEEASSLILAAKAAPTIGQRQDLLRRAEELMVADAPLIALFVPIRWSLVSPRVSGWSQNTVGAHPLSRLDLLPGL